MKGIEKAILGEKSKNTELKGKMQIFQENKKQKEIQISEKNNEMKKLLEEKQTLEEKLKQKMIKNNVENLNLDEGNNLSLNEWKKIQEDLTKEIAELKKYNDSQINKKEVIMKHLLDEEKQIKNVNFK